MKTEKIIRRLSFEKTLFMVNCFVTHKLSTAVGKRNYLRYRNKRNSKRIDIEPSNLDLKTIK